MTSHLRHARLAALLVVFAGPVAAQAGRSTPEVEPNDAAQTATLARLGDTISGTVNPFDIDYFAVQLAGGTPLVLIAAPVPFCRDFALLDPSGNRLAFGNCVEEIDTLQFTIPVTGRYLIRVTQFDDAPGEHPQRPYALHIGTNPVVIDVARVVDALLAGDPAALDPALRQRLDAYGNANGVLDVGDFRAYLRAEGLLRGGKWN